MSRFSLLFYLEGKKVMDLNFMNLFSKEINWLYYELKENKDFPYCYDDFCFLKKYEKLENLFEEELMLEILWHVDEEIKKDYSTYANETHLVFDELFLKYEAIMKVQKELLKVFQKPIISFSNHDEVSLSVVISKFAKDTFESLNYRYKELFLTFQDEEIGKLIQKEYFIASDESHSFLDLVKFLVLFNQEGWEFKRKMKIKKLNHQDLSSFLRDLSAKIYLFESLLKVDFQLGIINNYEYDDDLLLVINHYL